MKVLFFDAVAGHPAVVGPLMTQAHKTLRPFNRFLQQAVHTAKQRQTRYELPWKPVREVRVLHLEALDRRVRMPRRETLWRVVDWPAGVVPDASQPLMVVSRNTMVTVRRCETGPSGPRLELAGSIDEKDIIFWCRQQCRVVREAEAAPPSEVRTLAGQPLRLLVPAIRDPDGWILHLEGKGEDETLVVDGVAMEALALDVRDGVKGLRDAQGQVFPLTGGQLKVETLPAEGPLVSDGLRFSWRVQGEGRSGAWVQLLPSEKLDGEEFLDPRAAFCEDEVPEVWTQPRHNPSTSFRVKRVDRERYQLLLDRYPPENTTLFLPVDVRNLQLQRRALRQLADAPLPHHQGLLRLCEDPGKVRWPHLRPQAPPTWLALTDATRSGTDEQRRFVAKALATPDLAVLEGPPGSGKTTAICELIQQLVAQGQRVLLCASTHVAIDNVIERLLHTAIETVRIGKADKVDDKVLACQLDQRVEALHTTWKTMPHLRGMGDAELWQAAERCVVETADLTCGTTMGIVSHPVFRDRDQDLKAWERPITTRPHWDVLIVDEASKTLIQEFMVPALMAKRWIIVGDVRQLPPFADRSDVVANLRSLVDEKDREVFPADHQRACLLLFRLSRERLRASGARWLVVEPPGVLDWVGQELAENSAPPFEIVRIVRTAGQRPGPVREVTVADLQTGKSSALAVLAADWVLVSDDLLAEVAEYLPGHLLQAREPTLPETHPWRYRRVAWQARHPKLAMAFEERRDRFETASEAEKHEGKWLQEHDLAGEIAWRLIRIHELRRSKEPRERDRLNREMEGLLPYAADISEPIDEIMDIGLPSIIEVLQEGIGAERSQRPSGLTMGVDLLRHNRFESLSFQHRMHPDIAAFSRELIYDGQSLKEANTIALRDRDIGWDFGQPQGPGGRAPEPGGWAFPARRVWIDVRGREVANVNADEIKVMEAILKDFLAWAKRKGPPAGRKWEVACLCFYVKQERAISQMLQRLTGEDRQNRFAPASFPVEIVNGTVDRFQGREADLVLLSMRNTGRTGFLDSTNRLNVAVTRARQQLAVIGNADFFSKCRTTELEELVKRSKTMDATLFGGSKR